MVIVRDVVDPLIGRPVWMVSGDVVRAGDALVLFTEVREVVEVVPFQVPHLFDPPPGGWPRWTARCLKAPPVHLCDTGGRAPYRILPRPGGVA